MNFNEYQIEASKSAKYPSAMSYTYLALGLTNEAGEVAGKIKKMYRDNLGLLNEETRTAILEECGDVLWYLSELVRSLDAKLEDVAQTNIDKLKSRVKRGVISGNGDSR
jgi:NTP pyrophosphatase (non-canonical NTP hydrolase)